MNIKRRKIEDIVPNAHNPNNNLANILPNEIWMKILSYLDADSLSKVGLVSMNLFIISNDNMGKTLSISFHRMEVNFVENSGKIH